MQRNKEVVAVEFSNVSLLKYCCEEGVDLTMFKQSRMDIDIAAFGSAMPSILVDKHNVRTLMSNSCFV